jgi:Subtilase family
MPVGLDAGAERSYVPSISAHYGNNTRTFRENTPMRILRYTAVSTAVCLLAAAWTSADAAAPLAGGLREMSTAYDTGDQRLPAILKLSLRDRLGDPMVRVRMLAGANQSAVLAQLTAAGFKLKVHSSINPALVEGYLPLASLHQAANISGVHSIHASLRPRSHAGSVQSQAVALQKADIAQSRGFDGTGTKIGALSDSFDACAICDIHAADDIASGDLPAAGVTVLQDLTPADGGEDEGRAMLQLVHDIAPGAQLGFATAFVSELQFAENILALRSQFGADVIVDDVNYFDEPFYSDGILSQAVNIVNQAGAAYFSSAGNNGLEAFEDTYRPISFEKAKKLVAKGVSNIHLEQLPAAVRPVSIHNFNQGNGNGSAALTQHITTATDSVIIFQWDEPFDLNKVKTDYNVYLFDMDGNWLDPNTAPTVFYTLDDNIATDQPLELMEVVPYAIVGGAPVGDYQMVIGSRNNGPAEHIKYVADNTLLVSERQNAPSTFGHATATGAIGVAAMYYAIPSFPEDFSAPGPVTIYFDGAGNRLRRPEVRFTPQVTAADGVDTTFFPPGGSDPDGTGFPNFFGTSAAAPDAAAVAGLVIQAAGGPGSIAPRKVYERLEKTATPVWLPNNRWTAGTFAGPVAVAINKDWVRYTGDFSVEVQPMSPHRSVASITFDVSRIGLHFSLNPNRFSVSNGQGVAITDMTWTVSPDQTKFTIAFAPGALKGKESFDFGESVFAPIQGSTEEDPDRFRGMRVTVTMDNGQSFSNSVLAFPKLPINNFTGYGLVNADAATRGHDD